MIQLNLKTLFNKYIIRLRLNKKDLGAVELLVLDFDGVMTDNKVIVSESGVESVVCWRGDGIGIGKLKSIGVQVIIVSTETNGVVKARANKLGIEFRQKITDKGHEINKICNEYKIKLKNVVFLGNDANDIPGLRVVGFPIGVADAHYVIFPYIKFITKKKGGLGSVREVCELIYEAKKPLKYSEKKS